MLLNTSCSVGFEFYLILFFCAEDKYISLESTSIIIIIIIKGYNSC